MSFVFVTLSCLFGFFKYPIYIYHNKNEYIISVGCENFDSLEKAVEKAKESNCYCEKTHKILEIILDKQHIVDAKKIKKIIEKEMDKGWTISQLANAIHDSLVGKGIDNET